MTTVNDPKGEAGSKKAPMWLLPPVALEQTSWVHKLGNDKYGPFNWRVTGVCATTYVSAIMRHLNAWRDGEDLDPESGISHIAHIATSCNILMDAEACGTLQDDRNKRTAVLTREEAFQKLAESPPSIRVKVVDNDIKPGDRARILLLRSAAVFLVTIEKVVDIRGEKVYTTTGGSQYAESEIYSITHA